MSLSLYFKRCSAQFLFSGVYTSLAIETENRLSLGGRIRRRIFCLFGVARFALSTAQMFEAEGRIHRPEEQ
jgi:hypothetical protein